MNVVLDNVYSTKEKADIRIINLLNHRVKKIHVYQIAWVVEKTLIT